MNKEEKLKALQNNLKELEEKASSPDLGKGTAAAFARITGYCRQISNMNEGKQQEVKERKTYKF